MGKDNFVIVTKAPDINYRSDYVTLPKNYGTKEYYDRADVKAIFETVYKNLNDLDEKSCWTENVRNRRVLIKPNFVAVYHKAGFKHDDYPQSTDPRVLDAVVSFVKQYTDKIVIIEGSGAPVTRLMAVINGTMRIVKRYKIEFQAIEELPVDRYLLPKAQVMKEVFLPGTFSEVVRGEAFYISLPKMKTNVYTGVTLGFKNAMGCLSTHMRYRNHNYNINKKLVDLLWLLKPDLTVVDGIIGAQGNSPGPVEPVDSRLIISGTNSVETDRVATRIMGHDPDKIQLMQEADKLGFNDPEVTVLGEPAAVTWRQADTSVISGRIAEKFPNVRFLVGASKNSAPKIDTLNPDMETIKAMEQACPGGCLPSIIYNVEAIGDIRGVNPEKMKCTILLGAGAEYCGQRYYFDKNGRAYSRDDFRELDGPVIAPGSCTSWIKDDADYFVDGCTAHILRLGTVFSRAFGVPNPLVKKLLSRPRYAFLLLKSILKRNGLVKKGTAIDVELCLEDEIFDGRPLTETEKELDYIACETKPLNASEIKKQRKYILEGFGR